jgi:hypothetical protein
MQDFYGQERLSSVGVLQPYVKSSEGTSHTSLCRGVLNKIRHWDFFPTICSTQEKEEIHTNELPTRITFPVSSTKNSFFLFKSNGFCKWPDSFEILVPASLFLWGSHMRREYQKRTTLCSECSTIKGLLYAPDPDNCKKGTLSDQPWLSYVSSTAFCAVGDVVAQRYVVLCDWLWDACHMAGVVEGPAAKDFVARKARTITLSKARGSCHKTSNNQPYSRVWKSFEDSIPELYCIA